MENNNYKIIVIPSQFSLVHQYIMLILQIQSS